MTEPALVDYPLYTRKTVMTPMTVMTHGSVMRVSGVITHRHVSSVDISMMMSDDGYRLHKQWGCHQCHHCHRWFGTIHGVNREIDLSLPLIDRGRFRKCEPRQGRQRHQVRIRVSGLHGASSGAGY